MARQLSMATRRELKEAIGQRYRAAGGQERRQILDEFTRVTGYHRKHALRVLHRPFVPRPARPRKRIYDGAVRQALALLGTRLGDPAKRAERTFNDWGEPPPATVRPTWSNTAAANMTAASCTA